MNKTIQTVTLVLFPLSRSIYPILLDVCWLECWNQILFWMWVSVLKRVCIPWNKEVTRSWVSVRDLSSLLHVGLCNCTPAYFRAIRSRLSLNSFRAQLEVVRPYIAVGICAFGYIELTADSCTLLNFNNTCDHLFHVFKFIFSISERDWEIRIPNTVCLLRSPRSVIWPGP